MSDGAGTRDGIAGLDFSAVTPEEFAKIVKSLSPKEIDEIARDGELRARILAEVFARMERQFKPETAGSLQALIRWQVTSAGDRAEAVYETTIADGVCTVGEGRSDATPRVTLAMGDADFLKLVSGNSSPVTMFMMRKVKITGDVALAAGLNRYFDIPKP
ncbi:SCP2 sterol-binding domain-containing protein [Streptomyces sp. NPDC058067]|uniref:SCP2 sterol-binding domain-containing protein n=1 Tax=Streptomyces antnestii TaxID=2494256 RepID=A0A3S2VXF0_9ACTN|nr:SCP2 sterol-binding domain-containing protein [Streptomyces sp. San01]RVU24291.1 SCP2 sterol-binding domain-containing protein [Streptomyces sp. San01]